MSIFVLGVFFVLMIRRQPRQPNIVLRPGICLIHLDNRPPLRLDYFTKVRVCQDKTRQLHQPHAARQMYIRATQAIQRPELEREYATWPVGNELSHRKVRFLQ
jgi:hypothetical protein